MTVPVRALAGLLLLAAFAMPLFAPPGAVPQTPPTPDTALLERLFPGVPGAWMAWRLACLAAGAAFLASWLRQPPRFLAGDLPPPAPRPAPAAEWRLAALGASACAAGVALFAGSLPRAGQGLFFLALFAPSLLLLLGDRLGPPRSSRRRALPGVARDPRWRRAAVAVAAVLGLWLLLRAPGIARDLRSANPVDTWVQYEWFARAVREPVNVLTWTLVPGSTAHYFLLLGLPLLWLGHEAPTLAWLQGWNAAWLLAAAAGVAHLAGRWVSLAAAPVAAAAFLFSALTLSMPLSGMAIAVAMFYTAIVLALGARVWRTGSAPAWTCLGATAGLAATQAHLVHFALLAAACGLAALRRVRPSWQVVGAAALCAFAAAWPGIPDGETLRAMGERHVATVGQTAALEAVLLGQRAPYALLPWAWHAGHATLADLALGTLLSPFATPRMALRLWGDLLLEPVGACLVAVALAACARFSIRSGRARAWLALFAFSLLPGLTSSYDRPSLMRVLGAAPVLALLAGLGFECLRAALPGRAESAGPGSPATARLGTAVAAAVAGIAAGGVVLFDGVNPRILASSSLELAFRSLGEERPAGGALLLDHGGPRDTTWLRVRTIATALPATPVPVRRFEGAATLVAPGAGGWPIAEAFLWSPGLEEVSRVSAQVCRLWPGATLYVVHDRARLARLHAATPVRSSWRPALPPSDWEAQACPGAGRTP